MRLFKNIDISILSSLQHSVFEAWRRYYLLPVPLRIGDWVGINNSMRNINPAIFTKKFLFEIEMYWSKSNNDTPPLPQLTVDRWVQKVKSRFRFFRVNRRYRWLWQMIDSLWFLICITIALYLFSRWRYWGHKFLEVQGRFCHFQWS